MVKKNLFEGRIYLIFFIVIMAAIGISFRLFKIQILKHSFYTALAQDQTQILEKLLPKRGDILIQDRYGAPSLLATNNSLKTIYLVPRETAILDEENKKQIAQKLSDILELDEENILSKINKENDPFEALKSKLSDDVAQKIKDFNLPGVYFMPQDWRWYPQGNLASHVLGFVGLGGDQKRGQYGLEGTYEKELAGEMGFLQGEKDAFGRLISVDVDNFTPAKDGDSLLLTIDQNIQFIAEEKLRAVLERWQAESGTIIIEDPKTGAIKAMANFPNYNPNEYYKENNIDVFLNSSIQKIFEPGSIFKPITMSAGIDSGRITPETTYEDFGITYIGGYNITNAANRSYGISSMTKVLEKSINTGIVFAEKIIGHEIFKKYVEAFGFGSFGGIDLNNELSGNIANLKDGPEINYAVASFGQGIAVTPIQIVSAIGAIANHGKMMKPYLVEKIIHSDGQEVIIEPQIIREPITRETADKVTKMLVSTVENGYDKVKMKNYNVAGKTGTAQIPEGSGYGDATIHSFVGYAPAYEPAFLIFIKMDKPKGINFASDSLSPVFADIAKFLLNYYEIPPDR